MDRPENSTCPQVQYLDMSTWTCYIDFVNATHMYRKGSAAESSGSPIRKIFCSIFVNFVYDGTVLMPVLKNMSYR